MVLPQTSLSCIVFVFCRDLVKPQRGWTSGHEVQYSICLQSLPNVLSNIISNSWHSGGVRDLGFKSQWGLFDFSLIPCLIDIPALFVMVKSNLLHEHWRNFWKIVLLKCLFRKCQDFFGYEFILATKFVVHCLILYIISNCLKWVVLNVQTDNVAKILSQMTSPICKLMLSWNIGKGSLL